MNLPATGYINAAIMPQYEGVYPVKIAQTYDEGFSFFDGRYWRGIWASAAEAWQMRCAPISQDVYAWFDMT